MKRLFALFIAAISIGASAATLLPVQSLNPAGSTSGQTIVSTGASSAPAWGGVPVNGIAAIAANSVIGNATGSSAIPTAITVTGCNGAAQALQWTNGSGFGCNSSIATSGANSNITGLNGLTSPVALPGVTNGSSAAAGSLGENPTPGTGTAVSYTTNTAANCASISLPAGDWNVWGDIEFVSAGTTVLTSGFAGVSSTTGTLPGFPNEAGMNGLTLGAGSVFSIVAPMQVKNLSATTTIFLVGQTTFTTSTMTANCTIWAQRFH